MPSEVCLAKQGNNKKNQEDNGQAVSIEERRFFIFPGGFTQAFMYKFIYKLRRNAPHDHSIPVFIWLFSFYQCRLC